MESNAPYTMLGAARYLDLSISTIQYWINTGKLDATKVNGRWQISKTALDKANAESLAAPSRGSGRGKRGHLVRPTGHPTDPIHNRESVGQTVNVPEG